MKLANYFKLLPGVPAGAMVHITRQEGNEIFPTGSQTVMTI